MLSSCNLGFTILNLSARHLKLLSQLFKEVFFLPSPTAAVGKLKNHTQIMQKQMAGREIQINYFLI